MSDAAEALPKQCQMADRRHICDAKPSQQFRAAPGSPAPGVLIVGDARRVLHRLPAESVQCCVTSPPYWGLREGKLAGEIGIEQSLSTYFVKLRRVFLEVQRVLRLDGTLWLNIADCYTSGNRGWRAPDKKNPTRAMRQRPPTPPGLKGKELVGVPWRIAFALQKQGWYLRRDIVWYKPNAQPESVKDRPTQAHEYVFLFSKSEKYYYDYEAIREPANGDNKLKNRRSVWVVNTDPSPLGNMAAFPPKLVELCILAGTHVGDLVLDPFFGSGTVGLTCKAHRRAFLGIELNPEYAKLAGERLGVAPTVGGMTATDIIKR